jgi:hypothetical protein
MLRVFLPIFMMLFSMTACSPNGTVSPTPTYSSGIEGMVTEGPMCPGPVQVGNNTCPDQPYQATIIVLNSDDVEITQIQSDTGGLFKISLAPGMYVLHPVSGKTLPRAADQTVVINEGQFTQVSIVYDTGMR